MKQVIGIFCALMLFLSLAAIHAEALNPYLHFRAETYRVQQEYLQSITKHQQNLMLDSEQKLVQQQWQTLGISIMVAIMVLFGLVFSGLQFYADYKSNGTSTVTFKIGAGTFELSSTVIGIVILVLSFVFFQLYVEKVYNITVIDTPIYDVTTFGVNK